MTELSFSSFVTFELFGRLGRFGNQLFQIAATVGAARRNACECAFPSWPYEAFFARPLPRPTASLPGRAPLIEPSFTFHPIGVERPCHLVGYFQSEKYFAHCADEIRTLFAANSEIKKEMAARFGLLLTQKTCSIHVRRTDYLAHPEYTQLGSTDYYDRAMAHFNADTQFVVFSDDIAWCRSRFTGSRFTFIEGNSLIGDFFLMSACKNHIIANSSFSWWAAWLDPNPRKRVIAPRNWFAGSFNDPAIQFVAGPPHRGFHDTRDLLPEAWTSI